VDCRTNKEITYHRLRKESETFDTIHCFAICLQHRTLSLTRGDNINYLPAICLSTLFLIAAETQNTELNIEALNIVRATFYVAVDNEDTTVSLMNFIKDGFSKDHHQYPPVILAYYAALEGLRGRHASNPITKFFHVSRAVDKMNEALEKAPGLLEGHFLRFSFFHQIPGIFGVGGKVEGDLRETIALLEERDYGFVSEKIQQDMVNYLLRTDRLSPDQHSQLEILAEELSSKP